VVGKRTLGQYQRAVSSFFDWVRDSGRDPSDSALVLYFEHLFDLYEGRGRFRAVNTYYGLLNRYPALSGGMPLARRSLLGWSRLRPSRPHPPLTWPVTVALAIAMAVDGFVHAAVATLASFHLLLRASEALNIRVGDIGDSDDHRRNAPGLMYVRLRTTKTGVDQFVDVRDDRVASLLRTTRELAGSDPDARIFPISYAVYYRTFTRCRDRLRLPRFVPHSIRHGGATQLAEANWSIADVALRGRWKVTDSARRYIQRGRAELLALSVPVLVVKAGRALDACLLAAFDSAVANASADR